MSTQNHVTTIMKTLRSEQVDKENNNKNNDASPEEAKLFTGIIFYMRPCGARATIRDLVEEHGGTFAKISDEKVIILTDSCAHTCGYHVDFIHDSIKENQLQDVAKYKLPSYNSKYAVDKHQIKVPANMINKARQRYAPEEDEAIARYVTKFAAGDDQVGSIHGNVIWREMERKCVTLHSWQSMKNRYVNHIQHCPPKFKYAALDIGGGDVVSCNRKLVVSKGCNNSASELSTESNVNSPESVGVGKSTATSDKILEANKEFNDPSQAEHSVLEACSVRLSNVSVVIENLSGILKNNASGPPKEMNSKEMLENDHPDGSDEVNDQRLDDGVTVREAVDNSSRMSKDNVSESTKEVDPTSLSEHEPDAMEWVCSQEIPENNELDIMETEVVPNNLPEDERVSDDERVKRDKRLSEDSIPDATKEASCTKIPQHKNPVATADKNSFQPFDLSTTRLSKENRDAFFTDSESDDDDFDEHLISEALKSTPIPCYINTPHTSSSKYTPSKYTPSKYTPVYCECDEDMDYSEALKRREHIEKIPQDDSLWTSVSNHLIRRDVALKYGLSLKEVEQILLNQQS